MSFEADRIEIVQTGIWLEREGLVSSTDGNVSCRVAPGLIAISPTSIPYPEIEPADVVVTDLDGNVVEGRHKPSSELPFHARIYQERPDVGGVVHTHSPYATVLAIMRRPIPAVHHQIATLGVSEVPVVPYATCGTNELADNIAAVVRTGTNAALLANHGALAMAADLKEAAENAATLEKLATGYYRALVAGGGVVLSSEEVSRVIEQWAQADEPVGVQGADAPVTGTTIGRQAEA
jgi:L-fuculose-phosphate aldolase